METVIGNTADGHFGKTKDMQKIIWTIIVVLLGLGFMPFKFPRDSKDITDNELLVDHDESTCVSDFSIVKGTLDIPNQFRPYFTEQVSELTIKGDSPFDAINDNQGNWHIIADNQFIVSGKVIGVDSIYKNECGKYVYFQIDKWTPTKYHANFWTFNKTLFIAYFLTLFACILTSIILFFVRRPWKSKT